MPLNRLGQPVGEPVTDWIPPSRPPRESMAGRLCRLEPLEAERHAGELHRANAEDTENRLWTYMAYGPFETLDEFTALLAPLCLTADPLFFAIIDAASGRAVGVASYLRIDPANGCIEVGHIAYAPALQRTPAATEAMYLMMRRVFELGYRRYEWKCDALNAPSRAAALRLGFTFEGVFRQAVVYKGRNRDTAWYSIIDSEWPRLEKAFVSWLDPANFDAGGRQRVRLSGLTAAGADQPSP
jgi:RimJ/RimL family protein N-acetyltransferase